MVDVSYNAEISYFFHRKEEALGERGDTESVAGYP